MADLGSFFLDFAVAAAVGGLIGVEREHRGDQAMIIAGIRTFPLVSIAGFLTAFLARETESSLVLAAGVAGAFGIGIMFIQMRTSVGQTGLTTPIAMVVTFLLGIVIGYGYALQGVAVGIVVTFLLVTKRRLHRFAQVLDEAEIMSALQFVTVLFILLPLTATLQPGTWGQEWLGRGALVDPFLILLVVVFVSAISFASLLVMRLVGPRRGVQFAGLLGGLVNSEATTASLAQRARDEPKLLHAAIAGALLATVTMLFRNLAIAAFTDPSESLFLAALPYVLPVAAVGVLLALRRRRRHDDTPPDIRMSNPFAVWPALRFALIFAAASLVASLAQRYLGDAGVYVTAVGGFVSAGAVVASVASLHATGVLALEPALRTMLLAIAASIAGKLLILRATNRDAYTEARTAFATLSLMAILGAGASFVLG